MALTPWHYTDPTLPKLHARVQLDEALTEVCREYMQETQTKLAKLVRVSLWYYLKREHGNLVARVLARRYAEGRSLNAAALQARTVRVGGPRGLPQADRSPDGEP